MSDALAKARAIAAAANEQRAGMDDAHRDYYVPVGMFVGENTGFVVMPDVMVTAMLDAIEAAEMAVSPKLMGSAHQEAGRDAGYCDACLRSWPCEGAALSDALARVHDLIGDDL